jgi:SOS-response transcriptional repressor LexA
MGVSNITGNPQMNAMFTIARVHAERGVKKNSEAERERATDAFHKAVMSCDKTIGQMMDKHHESVKKSAEKLAAYLKKKAAAERAQRHAEDIRDMNEDILANRINHRNMLEELRAKALYREKIRRERDG